MFLQHACKMSPCKPTFRSVNIRYGYLNMSVVSKVFIPLFLCALSFLTNAEEGIYLHLSDQPSRSVKVINSTNSVLEFDIKGDEELLEKNRQRGINFPVKLSNYKSYRISTVTGPANQDGSFKFERKFEDVASFTENENGNRVRIPDAMEDMVGLVISGVIDSNGNMKVNNLSGGNINAEKKKILYSVFESMSLKEAAPKRRLKIGDSFSTKTPFAMPVPGQQPIQFNNNTEYKFKRIQGDSAIFDVAITFSLSNPEQGIHIKVEGTGTGVMEYNVKTQLQEKQNLKVEMKMVINAGNTKMSSSMKSESTMQQYTFNPDEPSPNKATTPPEDLRSGSSAG